MLFAGIASAAAFAWFHYKRGDAVRSPSVKYTRWVLLFFVPIQAWLALTGSDSYSRVFSAFVALEFVLAWWWYGQVQVED